MPRELRLSISVTVPLPDHPSRMAAVILGVDRAVDELRTATGGVVEAESEIVTPRKKEAVEQQPMVMIRGGSDGVIMRLTPPTVTVPPMDPAPCVGPQPVTIAGASGEDLLDVPAFLRR